jgi:hypothetical protein
MNVDWPLFLSLLGSITGIAAIILQFRKQKTDEVLSELRLKLERESHELDENKWEDDRLASISSLSLGLVGPLQTQLDALSRRLEVVETQSVRYRRWIAELVVVIQKLVLLLEDVGTNVNIHQELLKEVLSDPSVQAAINALDSASHVAQETPHGK